MIPNPPIKRLPRLHLLRLRKVLAGAALAVCLLAGSALSQDARFLPGLEDVPAQEGLSVATDDVVVFDSPAGRIVEIFATSTAAREDVLAFYRATLPELGWLSRDGRSFQRENEQLSIDIFGGNGNLSVRFTLAPL